VRLVPSLASLLAETATNRNHGFVQGSQQEEKMAVELPAGALASSSTRVVLQVIANHKSPELEVYHSVRNLLVMKQYLEKLVPGDPHVAYQMPSQDIFIEFVLVNIGAARAENVRLSIVGDFDVGLSPLAERPLFKETIPQVAPGQSLYLFRIDIERLSEVDQTGSQGPLKTVGFDLHVDYDGPCRGLNRIRRVITRIWKSRQYRREFRFVPANFGTDLPPLVRV
jgi:hypothetical protein